MKINNNFHSLPHKGEGGRGDIALYVMILSYRWHFVQIEAIKLSSIMGATSK